MPGREGCEDEGVEGTAHTISETGRDSQKGRGCGTAPEALTQLAHYTGIITYVETT